MKPRGDPASCKPGSAGALARLALLTSLALFIFLPFLAAACGDDPAAGGPVAPGPRTGLRVLADSSFLADIAQNVAGDRLSVESLLPEGADPHAFQPSPHDARRVAESDAIIINSPGLEPALDDLITGAGGEDLVVIEAAAGLPGIAEDPHCWLDPVQVLTYVENIRMGLARIDPEGEATFAANSEAYAQAIRELDEWIMGQVGGIPQERRLLVTNHESLGRFAERYGFRVVGSVFPMAAGDGSPSAQQLATLVEEIEATGTPAIFLEAGSNADLAQQVAEETGVRVITELYIHSLGPEAPTYLEMMRWNVTRIVEALR